MEVTGLRPSRGLISRPALHQRSGNFALATSQQGGLSLNVSVMPMSDTLKALSDREKEIKKYNHILLQKIDLSVRLNL